MLFLTCRLSTEATIVESYSLGIFSWLFGRRICSRPRYSRVIFSVYSRYFPRSPRLFCVIFGAVPQPSKEGRSGEKTPLLQATRFRELWFSQSRSVTTVELSLLRRARTEVETRQAALCVFRRRMYFLSLNQFRLRELSFMVTPAEESKKAESPERVLDVN